MLLLDENIRVKFAVEEKLLRNSIFNCQTRSEIIYDNSEEKGSVSQLVGLSISGYQRDVLKL